ncbi:hypothetical protein HK097_003205 [Rhizophlyctis rosea]|uniref:Glycosyltransferase 2-like domain-containing protein n=1 Tax=Rhizophlyctis rosea TaxID=64517 RepID=A0AAD5X6W7_9FUNG|nr:hypothetical protein HK097_003205 [Rhizophlyctis rosea]
MSRHGYESYEPVSSPDHYPPRMESRPDSRGRNTQRPSSREYTRPTSRDFRRPASRESFRNRSTDRAPSRTGSVERPVTPSHPHHYPYPSVVHQYQYPAQPQYHYQPPMAHGFPAELPTPSTTPPPPRQIHRTDSEATFLPSFERSHSYTNLNGRPGYNRDEPPPSPGTSSHYASDVDTIDVDKRNPYDSEDVDTIHTVEDETTEHNSTSNSNSSPPSSHRAASRDRRNSRRAEMETEYDAAHYQTRVLMAEHLFKVASKKEPWFEEGDRGEDAFGAVCIRYAPRKCAVYPEPNREIRNAVEALNVEAAIVFKTKVVSSALHMIGTRNELYFRNEKGSLSKLQVIESLKNLRRARKHQWAALLVKEEAIVVWGDSAENLLEHAKEVEKKVMSTVWEGPRAQQARAEDDEGLVKVEDAEEVKVRPYATLGIWANAVAFGISLFLGAQSIRALVSETAYDGNWMRMALVATLLITLPPALYLPQSLVQSVLFALGPISHLARNTQFYSSVPPKRLRGKLPHFTIQIPIYLEGLDSVIAPTVESIKRAISTYEQQGGSANIFVCDDGMQLLSEKEARRRKEYYYDNLIGFVARPKNGDNGYVRKGRFKKASNLNHSLAISLKVEDRMASLDPHQRLDPETEGTMYAQVLQDILQEVDEGRTWAEGDIRIGEYILLVDSDTRVPEDCFLDAASEFAECKDVAILQHASGAMLVTNHFWEEGMAYFTKLTYEAIGYVCASGDTAPFVGHNAFLRWSAIKDVSYRDGDLIKFWSESRVSEDFDMALRLQMQGYILRYITYTKGEFQEGVSLTVYDEIKRFEKYSYGASEVVFNPFIQWPRHGPFTKLFRTYLWSSVPLWTKLGACAYLFNYFAIGAGWILTMVNYFVLGWYYYAMDHFLLPQFEILITIMVIFGIWSPIALSIHRFRTNQGSLFRTLWENAKWTPLLVMFFAGLSFHISRALVCHLFSLRISWTATAKEADGAGYFVSLEKILKKYWPMYAFFGVLLAGIIFLAVFGNPDWAITTPTILAPALFMISAHMIMPLLLNHFSV